MRAIAGSVGEWTTVFGGREAEVLCLNDLSIGSSSDLDRATAIARALVEEFGMGGERVGVRRLERRHPEDFDPSEALKAHAEAEVRRILEEQRARAGKILRENRALVETLRDLLVEKKVLDRETLKDFFPAGLNSKPAPTER